MLHVLNHSSRISGCLLIFVFFSSSSIVIYLIFFFNSDVTFGCFTTKGNIKSNLKETFPNFKPNNFITNYTQLVAQHIVLLLLYQLQIYFPHLVYVFICLLYVHNNKFKDPHSLCLLEWVQLWLSPIFGRKIIKQSNHDKKLKIKKSKIPEITTLSHSLRH